MQAHVITALVTPYNEKGQIDFDSLDQLIQFQIDLGTQGLILCGSTGEGALLTREEKLSIFHRAVEVGKGVIELIANIGGCCTAKSVSLAKDAKNLGVDACIAIVPYYVKPEEEGCYLHFLRIAEVGLPLMVYHHPGRTGTELSLEALVRIAEIPRVVGIKEASGDLKLVEELIDRGVPLYCGDDIHCEDFLDLGAEGSISIVGNVTPDLWKSFLETKEMHADLRKLCETLVLETNPQCVKYALSHLGKCHPFVRPPLMLPREESQRAIKGALQIVESTLR